MKKKWLKAAAVAGVFVMAAYGCGKKEAGKEITVGSKGFTENLIVSELYSLALEDLGYQVERKFDLYSSVIHDTITNGEIDLYPEYTGTAWMTILGEGAESDAATMYENIKKAYGEKYNLAVLEMCEANDGNGLVIRREKAEELGITNISDLQKNAGELRFGSTADFVEREDGFPGIEKVYGKLNFKEMTSFDNALKYDILKQGEVDCVPAYTTDAQLADEDFLLLEDDKQLWPPYNLIPVIRQEVLDKEGEVEKAINQVSAALDTETMTGLNYQVDIEKKEYEEVAKDFYEKIQ